jgi:MFS family permease
MLCPYAGLLVDRFPKRGGLPITQAGLGLVFVAPGISVSSGTADLGQVVVLRHAFGTFSAADNPARQVFVADVAGRDLIRNAVTLNSSAVNVARTVGPAVAAMRCCGWLPLTRQPRCVLVRVDEQWAEAIPGIVNRPLAIGGCRRRGSGRFAAAGRIVLRRRRGSAGRCRFAGPGAA